jgi:hypothetical protein
MMTAIRLVAVSLIVAGGATLRAADPITTPFQLVPLWSEEMLGHMTGQLQPPCSGPEAGTCERLTQGVCEDTAYFTVPSATHQFHSAEAAPHDVPKQTQSINPQAFRLRVANAGHASFVYRIADPGFESIDLVLDCQFSGNTVCPTLRLHVGAVHELALGVQSGDRTVDLTRSATVRPDGTIEVRVDEALRASFLADWRTVYTVRVVAECFAVRPRPIEWFFPVREAPLPNARVLGAIVARLTPELAVDFAYRPREGQDIPFQTDWVEEDWGYTYLREQSTLDRRGDWFLLPPRPFPRAVWVHLPGRTELSLVSPGTIYTLGKPVRAQVAGTSRRVTLPVENLFVVAVHERTLEIRNEEESDSPCAGGDERGRTRRRRTYLVDAEEFYDGDGHLLLRPAYTRGC